MKNPIQALHNLLTPLNFHIENHLIQEQKTVLLKLQKSENFWLGVLFIGTYVFISIPILFLAIFNLTNNINPFNLLLALISIIFFVSTPIISSLLSSITIDPYFKNKFSSCSYHEELVHLQNISSEQINDKFCYQFLFLLEKLNPFLDADDQLYLATIENGIKDSFISVNSNDKISYIKYFYEQHLPYFEQQIIENKNKQIFDKQFASYKRNHIL